MYIVVSEIRKLAKRNGKRVGKSFIQYMNRRVYEIVNAQCKMQHSRVTLNAEDAEAADAFRMAKR